MNGNEQDILNGIWADVKAIQLKSIETGEKIAITSTKVEQLERWVGNINEKLEYWTNTGCPKGTLNAHDIRALKEEDKRTRESIRNISRDVIEAKDTAAEAKIIARNAKSTALSKSKIIIWGSGASAFFAGLFTILDRVLK